jgi:hypothetical protein
LNPLLVRARREVVMGLRACGSGLVLGVIALMSLASASAAQVYPGCALPRPAPTGAAHFVDPIHGSMHGDGSRAHPWRTLQEVVAAGLFATAPARVRLTAGVLSHGLGEGPIRPGDTVYLLSGDHGVVRLQGYFGHDLEGYANPEFITIAAAPGQTPVIHKLEVLGGSKWVFRGLTIQGLNTSGTHALAGTPNKDVWLVSLLGPHENIVFDSNHLLSVADVSGWSNEDWLRKRSSGILDYKGRCVAITNNRIENIGFGMQTQSSQGVLISGNTVDRFSDDGIDYGSSDLLIERNRITNSIEDGDGFHRDAMQGQPANQAVVENVTIRDNTVIRIADPALAHPAFLQGIDTFDGIWRNVTVSGNVVITDAWQGISYYGVHGARITGNILLGDSFRLLPCGNVDFATCARRSVAVDRTTVPRIVIHSSKTREPSTGVVIDGNVMSGIAIDPTNTDVKVSNNLCLPTDGKCVIGMSVDGKMLWAAKPGVYGDNNVIADFDARAMFVAFDPEKGIYDTRLTRRNPAAARAGRGRPSQDKAP